MARVHFRPLPRTAAFLLNFLIGTFGWTPSVPAQGTTGGTDVFVTEQGGYEVDRGEAVASDGTLFTAGLRTAAPAGIEILRSADGGRTWTLFGRVESPAGSEYLFPVLEICEGFSDRVYVAYVNFRTPGPWAVEVVSTPLGTSAGAWTRADVFAPTGQSFSVPDLVCDDDFFPDYYVYVCALTSTSFGNELWFVRSTDLGATWPSPYVIGPAIGPQARQNAARLDVGADGWIHAVWHYTTDVFVNVVEGVKTRRAASYADGGLAAWEPVRTLAATLYGDAQLTVDTFAASRTDGRLVMGGIHSSNPGPVVSNPGAYLLVSDDYGVNWNMRQRTELLGRGLGSVAVRPDGSEWALTYEQWDGTRNGYYLVRTSDPLAGWGVPQRFDDRVPSEVFGLGSLLSLPNHGGRWGMFMRTYAPERQLWFDAEWLGDPGVPNLDPGLPVALAASPASPPLVAQLDVDPELEIVFSDVTNRLQVYGHDGVPALGWPITVGPLYLDSPVAAGDLNGDGRDEIVVADANGKLYAFAGDGQPRDGFPLSLDTGRPGFAVVGPVLAPYPRSIVFASEKSVAVIDWRGRVQKEWPGVLTSEVDHAPSIGDVDADGSTDILVPHATRLTRLAVDNDPPVWTIDLAPLKVSAPVTLVDLDENGELLILVPCNDGALRCFSPDGNLLWTYTTGTGFPLGRVAAAQIVGTTAPDIALSALDEIHLVLANGSSHPSYPQSSVAGAGGSLTEPVLDAVHWGSSDIVTGSSASQAWAFVNIGGSPAGWPANLPGPVTLAPATGDVDGDGDNEIVLLTGAEMLVYDVNHPVETTARLKWPMAGHDAGRTNCAACAEEIVTATGETVAPTRVSFADPLPNPMNSGSSLRFDLPRWAGVQLDVFDARGRRVRGLLRRDFPAGSHVIHFDGRDDRGEPLSNGVYFARLFVRSADGDHEIGRKISVQR